MFAFQSLPIPSKGDVNLVCGIYLLPEVFPELGNIFAPGGQVIHIDLNAYEIAKNHPVDVGLVSGPKLTLAKLGTALEAILTPVQREAAKARTLEIAKAKETKLLSQ
jgi:thiamine pyrophosphate-dependent acetolactate synthase large subunit-like protein